MKFFKIFIFSFLSCIVNAFAGFSFVDSTRDYHLNFGVQLMDSLAFTNLKNAPTHKDNAMSISIFLDGNFTKNFWYNAHVKVSTDYTNRNISDHFYNPDEGIPYNKQSENKRTWDIFTSSINYQLKPVKLMAGFDYLAMGPARRNAVILRGDKNTYRPWNDSTARILDPAPTPYFGYAFSFGIVDYTQYAAQLFEKKNFGKYIHIHRLNFRLPFDIQLGISETALYGSTIEPAGANPNLDADSSTRDFEWNYVIPFIPYMFQEHLQGDQDNISLAFDLSIKTIPYWEFYAELLWDDMKSPTSMFDASWWGNKWAATLGIARDSLRIGRFYTNFLAEYTRIEPWVYTHHKGKSYTYANYSQSLGSDLGPNAQEFYTELSLERGMFQIGVNASAVAKDTSFSSNIYDIHGPEDATDKKFLNENSTLNYYELGASFKITPWRFIEIRGNYSRYFGDFEGFHTSAIGILKW